MNKVESREGGGKGLIKNEANHKEIKFFKTKKNSNQREFWEIFVFSSKSFEKGALHCLVLWTPPLPKPLPVYEESHCGPNTVLILLLRGVGEPKIRAFSHPLC